MSCQIQQSPLSLDLLPWPSYYFLNLYSRSQALHTSGEGGSLNQTEKLTLVESRRLEERESFICFLQVRSYHCLLWYYFTVAVLSDFPFKVCRHCATNVSFKHLLLGHGQQRRSSLVCGAASQVTYCNTPVIHKWFDIIVTCVHLLVFSICV